MPGPYSFGARDSFLGPGFDLSREKIWVPGVPAPPGGSVSCGFLGRAPPSLVRVVSLGPLVLERVAIGVGNSGK